MLEQLRLIMQALPWTAPAVLGGAVVALLSVFLFPTRRSHSDRFGFALLLWCLIVALVVTLSPVKNNYFGVPTLGCDWSVWRPLSRQYWFSAGSRPPNIWLLVPAGVGVMLLDGFWRRFILIVGLFALPPGIEAIQDLYPELKRSCSSQDVADNWTGLVMGLAAGLVLALLVGLVRMIRRRFGPADGRARVLEAERAVAVETGHAQVQHSYPADDGAASYNTERLPLGGGAVEREHYDDFADFDDRPNSTVWHESREREAYRAGTRAPQSPRSYGAPARVSDDRRDDTPVQGYDLNPMDEATSADGATRAISQYDDPDITQVIRRPRNNR